MKFKVGDRVSLIRSRRPNKHEIGQVTSILTQTPFPIKVHWDGYTGRYLDIELTLIKSGIERVLDEL